MTALNRALERLRDAALDRLATREQLVRSAAWRRLALRKRRLPAALAILRQVTRAGRLGRIWIWLVASSSKRR